MFGKMTIVWAKDPLIFGELALQVAAFGRVATNRVKPPVGPPDPSPAAPLAARPPRRRRKPRPPRPRRLATADGGAGAGPRSE